MPLYEILVDNDLAPIESDYAVYMAVRIGPHPHFRDIQLVYQQAECDASQLINLTTSKKFRRAPGM